MSVIPPSIIKTYAEALGITGLSEDVLDILAQDAEYRAREIIQEANKFMIHGKRTKLTIEDLNYALQCRNIERMYGYEPTEPLNFRPVPNSSIFYIPKGEFDLMEFVQQPLPKAPQPLTLTSHWLAIDGVQPAIPENPQPVVYPLGVEKETSAPLTNLGTSYTVKKDEEPEIKPLVKHVLSKELQTYHDAILASLQSSDTERIKAALHSVANDSGLQQLLPYFVQWIAESVLKNLRNLPQLTICINSISSLLTNEYIFVEPYLHQLMPPLLSCLLGKSICENPEVEDHWSLRDRCATIVSDICQKFGHVYTNLVPRVAKTLHKTLLDGEKPLTCHYGAIIGISALGTHSIQTLLIPNVQAYCEALGLDRMRVDAEQDTATVPIDVVKVNGALRNALMRWQAEINEATVEQKALVNDLLTKYLSQ